MQLKTYVVEPADMAQMAAIAKLRRLSLSALLRVVVGDFLRREKRRTRLAAKATR